MRKIKIAFEALSILFLSRKWSFLDNPPEFNYQPIAPFDRLNIDQLKIFEYDIEDYIQLESIKIATKLKPWGSFKQTDLYDFNYHPVLKKSFNCKLPSNLNLFKRIKNFDVKYLWEIGRFQFIIPKLLKSENPKDLFFNNLVIFLTKNPIGLGFHWSVSMEISIRAINIYVIANYLEENYGLTTKEKQLVNGFLDKSLELVINNPEYTPHKRGNHYLTNLSTIIILGFSKKGKENTKETIPYLLKFLKEINIQFFDDGSLYEGSTWYHCFSLELIEFVNEFLDLLKIEDHEILVAEISELQGKKYSSIKEILEDFNVDRILSKGDVFRNSVMKPNGEFYQIGDTDSGRFIYLNTLGLKQYSKNIQRSQNETPRFKKKVKHSEKLILTNIRHNIIPNTFNDFTEFYFKDFGLYVRKNDFHYLGFRCGGNRSKPSHLHDDQMSIELTLDEKEIYIDPGTFRYNQDPIIRQSFISGRTHNGYKRYTFLDKENLKYQKFNMSLLYFGEIIEISEHKIEGQIKTKDFIFSRAIHFYKDYIDITDSLNSEAKFLLQENKTPIDLKSKFISKHYGHYKKDNSSMRNPL